VQRAKHARTARVTGATQKASEHDRNVILSGEAAKDLTRAGSILRRFAPQDDKDEGPRDGANTRFTHE
jgi:hypothetical protein